MTVRTLDELRQLNHRIMSGDRIGAWRELRTGTPWELDPRTALVSGNSNAMIFDTAEGLVIVDTGSRHGAQKIFDGVRQWSDSPVHTIIFTHGHFDHVFAAPLFDAEADAARRPRPTVIAHENTPARFDRYRETRGYNGVINERQFGRSEARRITGEPDSDPAAPYWPAEWRYPDRVYRDRLELTIGGEPFILNHALAETDDHTWVHVPGRKIVCSGDLFLWSTPNAGNPQKVQRYARGWASAMRAIAAVNPELMLSSHGPPLFGHEQVQTCLDDVATLLEGLVEQTIALMNQGATLNHILHEVKAPAELLAKPYLVPNYDEPEFIVRNIWRLYGGWYDGNPANLEPARDADLAREIARLAGGPTALAARALELLPTEERVATHLAEFAYQAAPEDPEVRQARATVYRHRESTAESLMAKGVYTEAATRSLP